MNSSPRFRRGTSVIAALVFAAFLGAIAIGLNAYQSNSVNTVALPAQAAAAVASDETCVDGEDFNYVASSQTTAPGNPTDYSGFFTPAQTVSSAGKPTTVIICPPDSAALTQAEAPGSGAYQSAIGVWQNLPQQIVIKPGQTVGSYTAATKRNASACQNNQVTPEPITTPLCVYIKQANNTYQLQNWKCRVTLSDSGSNLCWVKDVPVGTGGVNSVPPGQPGSGGQTANFQGVCLQGQTTDPNTGQCVAASVTADSGLTTVPNNCNKSSISNIITCVSSTDQTATVTAANPGYQCSTSNEGGQISTICTPPGTTCPSGQTGTPPNCTATPAAPAAPAAPVSPGGGTPVGGGATPGAGTGTGNNNSALSGLTSFLSGLTKGLLSPCSSTAQSPNNGSLVPVQTFNPTTGTYTTTYVQQQATTPYSSSPCNQQTPYGVGNNGVACAAPPAAPQCAAGATAEPTSASGNGCTTGYQCVPTSSTFGQTPTPQISCSPQTADVGQAVTLTYSCQNATGSTGEGFSTNNQLSGTATSTVATPPAGTNTANYGLTCSNNGQTASAQCSVQVAQPAIDLVADPQFVQSGETASIGWVTAGMQSCVISSPQDLNFTEANANSNSVNGVAQTDAITQNTEFDLTCQTLGGESKKASTIVSIGTGTSTATTAQDVTVSSTADGQTVNHGDTVTITWSSTNAPSGSVAAIWLIDLQSQVATAVIADDQPASGSYSWQIPAASSSCDPTTFAPCGSDLVAGDSYGIEVAMYTPSSAYIGPAANAPANSVDPNYADYGYTTNVFAIGQ